MKTNSFEHGRALRFACTLPILFISAACLTRAEAVITSGGIIQSTGLTSGGSVVLDAPGTLSLSGTPTTPLRNLPTGPQTMTFNPTASVSLTGPLSDVLGNSNFLYLNYSGTVYSGYVTLQMNLAGVPTAPILGQNNVSNVPFSMSGTVTVYSSIGGPVVVSTSISGSGIYSASYQSGYLPDGTAAFESFVTYQFMPGPSALAHGLDTTTQGSWNATYGGDGYMIANGVSSLPSYATVNITGDIEYTWASLTTDPRALQNGANAIPRIASAYTQNPYKSFTINLSLTDGNTHFVAFYLLDWDTTTRSETITITDADSGTVLDTQTFTNFENGEYAIWNLQGNLTITVVPNTDTTPAISGIFFGPAGLAAGYAPLGNSSFAAYVGADTTTGGAWTGNYGAAGYMIANGATLAPPYAAVSLVGDFTYTWANVTSDPRALQTAPGSTTATAAAFTQYTGASFSINVNITDGGIHPIALYLLDWDTTFRTETITIMDANTNAMLDSETFSAFQGGEYAVWNVSGNVVITVTPTDGSPVVSGLFFN